MAEQIGKFRGRPSASQEDYSKRDVLSLATAAFAAPLLPTLINQAHAAETPNSGHDTRRKHLSYVNVGEENSTPIEIYYEDHGSGSPVVLIHGWPLNGDAWEKQTSALLAAGHRVITYDRRGFGRSSKPGIGYNYDTFASDLNILLNTLDLTAVSLVGHSMGTGEITRYIGKYGTKRLRKAVLIGTLGPYLVKTADNPEGIDASVFSGLKAGIKADRPATITQFLKNFYSVGGADGKLVSDLAIQANWTVAMGASPIGTLACIDAWLEDFRKDISRNDLPTMIIHGDDDRALPADATSRRQAKMIRGVKFIEIEGGSHGLLWTHAEEINTALVEFLA
jgi:pimeloyl-ACP methyl ester carboxylesterase